MAKATQSAADYVAQSAKADERCAICTMFRPPSACTAVSGTIAPAGWCKFFKRRPLLAKEGA